MVTEVEIFGFGEEVYAVERVESAGETACELQVLFLVFAYGHLVGLLYQNVDGHEGGIGEQAGVDALVGVRADDLLLDIVVSAGGSESELLAGLVFERGCAQEFADAHVHVEQEIHFRDFGHVALHEDSRLFGVDAGGEIFGKDILYVLMQRVGVRIGGQGVEVGDEEQAIIVVLHFDELAQSSVIVSEMKVSGGAYAGENHFFIVHNMVMVRLLVMLLALRRAIWLQIYKKAP